MTTANKITILRILLVPFFVVRCFITSAPAMKSTGLSLCCVSPWRPSATVDGYIARRYNQWSELGTILDPLADKLLLVSGVIVLSFNNLPWLDQVPLWLTGTIIGRDLLILVGMVVIHMTVGKVKVRPIWLARLPPCFR